MISGNEKETNRLAQRVIDDLMLGDNIILLKGDLGAGKNYFFSGSFWNIWERKDHLLHRLL